MKKTRLKNLIINENSLVDKGANQLAFITLFKRDEEEVLKGMTNGSLFGKVKNFVLNGFSKNMDHAAMNVDETLAATNARDDWWKLTCAFEKSIMSILQDETADQASMLTESCMQFITKAKQLAPYLQDMYKTEGVFTSLEAICEDVSKAGKQISTANMERLKAAMKVLHELMGLDMEEYEAIYGYKKPDDKKPKSEMKKSDIDNKTNKGDGLKMDYKEIIKNLDENQVSIINAEIAKAVTDALAKTNQQTNDEVKKQLDELGKQNDLLAKSLEVERDMRVTKEFVEIAKSYKDLPIVVDDFGKVLKELSTKAPDQYTELIKILDASNKLISENNIIMKEIGAGGQLPIGDAVQKLNIKADEIKKAHPELTFEIAFAKALRENPSLYDDYNLEKNIK